MDRIANLQCTVKARINSQQTTVYIMQKREPLNILSMGIKDLVEMNLNQWINFKQALLRWYFSLGVNYG